MQRTTTRTTLGLILLLGALAGCERAAVQAGGKATVDRAAEEAALRAADIAWSDAAGRKDVDATVAFMAPDGETLGPNEPAARGAAEIRKAWTTLIGLPGAAVQWKPLRVQVAESGELGYTSGEYTLSFTGPDGKPVNDKGKYLEVWKKIDGKWKCLMDCYNSNLPLP